MIQKSYDNSASLYLIPTPIGNMEDITFRAINTLKSVDIVFCEDTRETLKLLKYYNITKKTLSCHQWNEKEVSKKILDLLSKGLNIGLVTDQGTPIISDPGFFVARDVINNGYNVISLPGATAFVPALTSSGLESSPFMFYGFLNSKKTKKKKELNDLKNYYFTMIFYESPHRLYETLEVMLEILGDRNICICREISKIHEEIYRGKISEFSDNIDVLKGEFVIVVSGSDKKYDFSEFSISDHVKYYISEGLNEKDAIKQVSIERNVAKSIIYNDYHKEKNRSNL